jgi:hypothetical protein
MRRREFVAGLGSAAAWPLMARAQQPKMPVIGYLYGGSPEATADSVAAFRNGLSEFGYVEGSNVAIEFRYAQNELDRLPELAADLVRCAFRKGLGESGYVEGQNVMVEYHWLESQFDRLSNPPQLAPALDYHTPIFSASPSWPQLHV